MLSTAVKRAAANLLPRSIHSAAHARIAAWSIATRRRYAPEIDLLPKFVRSGAVVVDVGAGHGLYTYHLSHLVGPAGTVHAFEPFPVNLHVLRHTVKSQRLTNVAIHPQGCGEIVECATFGASIDHGIRNPAGQDNGRKVFSLNARSSGWTTSSTATWHS